MKDSKVRVACLGLIFSLVSNVYGMDNLVNHDNANDQKGSSYQVSKPKDRSSNANKVYGACQRNGMIFSLADFNYQYPIENQLFGCKITLKNKYTGKELEFSTKKNDLKTKNLAKEEALGEVYENLMKPLIEAWDKAEEALNRKPGSLEESTVKGLSTSDIEYIYNEKDSGKFFVCEMKINDSVVNLVGKGMTKEEAKIDLVQKFCSAYGEWMNDDISKEMDNVLKESVYAHTRTVDGIVIKDLRLKDVNYKYEKDNATGQYCCGIKVKGKLLFFGDGWFANKADAKKDVVHKFNDKYGVWLRGDLKRDVYESLKVHLDKSEVEKILVKELDEVLRNI